MRTIKVYCCNWAFEKMTLPDWWSSDSDKEIEITTDQLLDLYESGINVMLYKNNTLDASRRVNILFVDTRRFGQR